MFKNKKLAASGVDTTEHAVEPGFGPDTDIAMRSGIDGLRFFQSVLKMAVNS